MKAMKKTLAAAVCLVGIFGAAVNFAACGEHEHSWSSDWSSDATEHWHRCTTDDCTEKGSSAAHTYGEWAVVTAATEQAAGKEERACTVCDYKEEREIAKLTPAAPAKHEHDWGDWTVAEEPTADKDGKATRTCANDGCDAAAADKEHTLPKLGSDDYEKGNDSATCTASGTVKYKYDKDGVKVEFDVATAKKAHTMTHTQGTPANGCLNGVLEHWTCSECEKDYADAHGETELTSKVDLATGHSMTHTEADPATCTKDGVLENWHCSACGKDFADERGETELTSTVDPAGHKLTHTEADPATCLKDGVLENWHCSVCEKDFSDENAENEMSTTVDPKKAHTMTHTEADPATCTKDGVLENWHCSECGKDYSDENGENEMTTTVDPKKAHTMTHTEADPATCTKDGVLENWHCSECGKDYSDENGGNEMSTTLDPQKSHVMTHTSATPPATCTDGVLEHWHCSSCEKDYSDANGENEMETTVDPAKHNPVNLPAESALCETSGHIEYWHCSECEKDFFDEACTSEVEDPEDLAVPAAHKLTAVAEATSVKSYKYPDSSTLSAAKFAHYKCEVCGKTFVDNEATNEITAIYYYGRRGAFASLGNNLINNTNKSGNAVTYIADRKAKYIFTFDSTITVSNINYVLTGTKANASPSPYANSKFDTTSGAYSRFESENATPLTNSVVVNMEKGEWITITVSAAKFTVNIETAPILYYGENTIAITEANAVDVDVYKFTPTETKTYSMTLPAGLFADLGFSWSMDASEGSATKNFDGVEGEELTFNFTSAKVGAYTVTIGEEFKLPTLTPEEPLNDFAVSSRSASDSKAGVALAEIGDIEEGSYTLSIKLSRNLLQSAFIIAINPETLDYTALTGVQTNGNLDTAASKADVIFGASSMSFWKGQEEYSAEWNGSTMLITMKVNLKKGDKLAFAHNNGMNATVSLSLVKA